MKILLSFKVAYIWMYGLLTLTCGGHHCSFAIGQNPFCLIFWLRWWQAVNKSKLHKSRQNSAGWHQLLLPGFSTVYGSSSQSNFIYHLNCLCICWAKHSSISEPLAFSRESTRTTTSQCHWAAESFRSSSHAPSSAPQWDYDRSVRCQQELMNIPFHKARVILPTKCPPHW